MFPNIVSLFEICPYVCSFIFFMVLHHPSSLIHMGYHYSSCLRHARYCNHPLMMFLPVILHHTSSFSSFSLFCISFVFCHFHVSRDLIIHHFHEVSSSPPFARCLRTCQDCSSCFITSFIFIIFIMHVVIFRGCIYVVSTISRYCSSILPDMQMNTPPPIHHPIPPP